VFTAVTSYSRYIYIHTYTSLCVYTYVHTRTCILKVEKGKGSSRFHCRHFISRRYIYTHSYIYMYIHIYIHTHAYPKLRKEREVVVSTAATSYPVSDLLYLFASHACDFFLKEYGHDSWHTWMSHGTHMSVLPLRIQSAILYTSHACV